jgi:hypothetical protein
MLARTAYLWGWPLVNMANRAAAFAKAPEPGLLGGIIPVAYNRIAMLTGYISPDQHFITCPNQDVAYGASPHGNGSYPKAKSLLSVRTVYVLRSLQVG